MIGGDGINDESNKTAPAPTRNTDLTKNMNATIDKTGKLTSPPSRGAWIEIFEWRTCWPMKRVAPLTGCVD